MWFYHSADVDHWDGGSQVGLGEFAQHKDIYLSPSDTLKEGRAALGLDQSLGPHLVGIINVYALKSYINRRWRTC